MSDVVRVQRQKIAQSFTCFACKGLFVEATTITECLHTFCKKCIYDKIEVEEIECCPKCNKNLGASPLEILRYDFLLQSMRNKIFGPPETKEPESSGSVPSSQLPPNPKNISLSSLEISEASNESRVLAKDKKPTGESSGKKVLGTDEGPNEESNTSGLKRSKRLIEKRNRAAKENESNEEEEEETSGVKTLYLSDLVKDSNKAKSVKSKGKGKKPKSRKSSKKGSQSGPVKPQEIKQGQEASSQIPAPNAVDSSGEVSSRNPIWFSLVASEKQEVGERLPQMSAPYLRIKVGTMTVSTVKKYIVHKFNLASEDEVELTLLDQPLENTTTLDDLVEQWIQVGPKSKILETPSDISGKDIVMILGYARKANLP